MDNSIIGTCQPFHYQWELACGEKETELFQIAIETLAQVIEQTDDLSLVTDGERRYGNLLFEICQEVVRTGRAGRPPTLFKEGSQSQGKK